MNEIATRKTITVGFNVVLIVYLTYLSFVSYLFSDDRIHVPMDDFFNASPGGAMCAAFLLLAAAVFAGAWLIKIFWNRLITDLFSVRRIEFQEALAMLLIMAIFAV